MIKFQVNKPDEGVDYKQRVGAYAVIFNENNKIAIVKTSTGYFLPGGGIEEGENHEACLKRECIEEMGMDVEVGEMYACGNYFFYSTTLNINMESVGNFYRCRGKGVVSEVLEDDHVLVWLAKEQALKKLFLKHQRKALELY